jgi:hypothetical protein
VQATTHPFSFVDEGRLPKAACFEDYVLSLVSTAIDSHVSDALLLGGEERIHYIRTDTGTFEFRKALEKDLGSAYDGYKDAAAAFLKDFCYRKRRNYAAPKIGLLAERINAYYRALAEPQEVHVRSGVYQWTSNSLNLRSPDEPDFCDVDLTIQAAPDSVVSVLGVTYLSGDAAVDLGDVKIGIFDRHDIFRQAPVRPRLSLHVEMLHRQIIHHAAVDDIEGVPE